MSIVNQFPSPDTVPRISKTMPSNGGRLFNTTSPVTVVFTRALSTSATLGDYVTAYNTSDHALVTPLTVTYNNVGYALQIDGPWVGGKDYLVVLDRQLPSAFDQPLGDDLNFRFKVSLTTIRNSQLLGPADGTRHINPPTLSWQGASGATLHEVQISRFPTFDTLAHIATVGTLATANTTISVTLGTTPLVSNAIHYWRVRGVGSEWTGAWDFYYGTLPTTTAADSFYINYFEPADKRVLYSVSQITIHLSATPVTPSYTSLTVGTTSVYNYTTEYWRVRSSVGIPDTDGTSTPWYGTWAVGENVLVWTPQTAMTLATNMTYDLYLNNLQDENGRAIDWGPGEVVYSASGPYSPSLVSASLFPYQIPEAEAYYYLWLGSQRATDLLAEGGHDITWVISGTTISTVATEEVQRMARRYSLLYGILKYRGEELGAVVDPYYGRNVRLGDYLVSNYDGLIGAYDEYETKYLKSELDALALVLTGGESAYTGGLGYDWDPALRTNDHSYYGAGLSREFRREKDLVWRGWKGFPQDEK